MSVKIITQSSTGSAIAGHAKVLGIDITNGTTAGTVVLTDGSGGATIATIPSVAGVAVTKVLSVGGGGLQFNTEVWAILTNATAVTLTYEDES